MQTLSNWWYGKSATSVARPPSPPNPQTSAQIINDSVETIEGLYMKRAQLVKKSEAAELEARKIRKTNRPRALLLMKQKQAYDNQIATYNGMILNMEQTAHSLDTAAITIDVAKTMQAASNHIKDRLGELPGGVADIDAVADDLDDSMTNVREMSGALSRPFGGGGDLMDDDELMAQMEDWDNDEVELPDAPNGGIRLPQGVKERQKAI